MSVDLGIDLHAPGGDLDPDFVSIEGAAAVAQALGHRLSTPSGGLFYDPEYESLDLREWLSAGLDDAEVWQLRARIERALRQDERVYDVELDVDFNVNARTLTVTAEGTSAAGPFRLVVAASEANVAILEASAL